jgi:hypothetical protein
MMEMSVNGIVLIQDKIQYWNLFTTVINIQFKKEIECSELVRDSYLLNTDSAPRVVFIDIIIMIVIMIVIIIPQSFNFFFSSDVLPYTRPTLNMSVCLSLCQITWHGRTMTVLWGGGTIRGVPPSVCSCRGNFSSFWCEVLQKEVSASKLIPGAPSQIHSENFIWLSFILWFTLSFLILLFGLTFVLLLHFFQMMFYDVLFVAFKQNPTMITDF